MYTFSATGVVYFEGSYWISPECRNNLSKKVVNWQSQHAYILLSNS